MPSKQLPKLQAKRNAKAILAAWQLGTKSLARCPADKLNYGDTKTRMKQEAEAVKAEIVAEGIEPGFSIHPYTLARMRSVAQEFSREDIKQLASSIREFNSRFSTTHLFRVVAVQKKARKRIVKDAVRYSWGWVELDRNVRLAALRWKQGSGREPGVPDDVSQRLILLGGLTTRWLRWTERACKKFDTKLRDLVDKANTAVEAVQEEVKKTLKQRHPLIKDPETSPR